MGIPKTEIPRGWHKFWVGGLCIRGLFSPSFALGILILLLFLAALSVGYTGHRLANNILLSPAVLHANTRT